MYSSFNNSFCHSKPHSATSNETAFSGDLTTSLSLFFPGLTPQDIQEILNEYPQSAFETPMQRGVTIVGDLVFRCGVSLVCGSA